MKYILLALIIAISLTASSQEWHKATEKLKYPKISGFYSTIGYFNRYDMIHITYFLKDDTTKYTGYKFVYVDRGFYTDNSKTRRIFFNGKKERIKNVEKYFFN